MFGPIYGAFNQRQIKVFSVNKAFSKLNLKFMTNIQSQKMFSFKNIS